jgi:hypothetical protein
VATNYRVILFNKRGRFSAPRYAVAYKVFYGKRQVVPLTLFHSRTKSVKQKKFFLEKLVKLIDKKRLEILALRRKKAEKLKVKRKRQRIQPPRFPKGITKKQKEEIEAMHLLYDGQLALAYQSYPNFPKTVAEEPRVFPNATISEVMITPVIPTNDSYTARTLYKEMTYNNKTDEAMLNIFDLNLKTSIPINAKTFGPDKAKILSALFPHIQMYFKDVKADEYLLRIKFDWEPTGSGSQARGISIRRGEVPADGLGHLFSRTIDKFFGTRETQNYLKADTTLYIKGFTFEAFTPKS